MHFYDGEEDGGAWTTVRYGRRHYRNPRALSFNYRGRPDHRMDRAFPVSGWKRAPRFPNFGWSRASPSNPNWPAPPMYDGSRPYFPQPRSYAAAVRGSPTRRATRFGPPADVRQDLRRPADERLGQLIRKLHAVIKMVHHLQNVTITPDRPEPLMIARIVDSLTSLIKPADPTDDVLDLIEGNAKNWGQNTLQILQDHYQKRLEKLLQDLPGDLTRDWREAFIVATRWACRNLPRITQDVLDQAEALIITCRSDSERRSPAATTPPPGRV